MIRVKIQKQIIIMKMQKCRFPSINVIIFSEYSPGKQTMAYSQGKEDVAEFNTDQYEDDEMLVSFVRFSCELV